MSNEWEKPKSPPPPLFLGEKERDLVKQVNDELIEKLNKQGTHVLPKDSITIRAVTNLMVSESQINIALDHVRNVMKS